MTAFIDANRARRSSNLVWGVEPICAVLQVAPSPYYAAKKRPLSARAVREAELKTEIVRVYEDNFAVYGADKTWAQLNCEGNHGRQLRRRAPDGHARPYRRPSRQAVRFDDHDLRRAVTAAGRPS